MPGELRLSNLLWVFIVFLAVDWLAYSFAGKMVRNYRAVTAAASDKRVDALGERIDAAERQLRSLTADVSKAATTAAGAAKQSQGAVETVNR